MTYRDATIFDVASGRSVLDEDVIAELDAAHAVSPQQLAQARQRGFYSQFEVACACTPRELREEADGSLECARCSAKLRRRRIA